jgi:hypothetical protein
MTIQGWCGCISVTVKPFDGVDRFRILSQYRCHTIQNPRRFTQISVGAARQVRESKTVLLPYFFWQLVYLLRGALRV